MMKRSVLATAVAVVIAPLAAVAAGNALAATVFESEDTRVDLHGHQRLAIVSTDGDNDFRNLSSRFGFRFNHVVDPRLSVYANTEFRFEGSEVNSDAMTVRNTFFGVNFPDIGRITAGNFDSIDGDSRPYLLGASDRFSQPMYGFAELSTGNAFASDDRPRITLGARYNF